MKEISLIIFLSLNGIILSAQEDSIVLNQQNSNQTRRQVKSTYVSNLRLKFEPKTSKFSKTDSLAYFNTDTLNFRYCKKNGDVMYEGSKPPSNYLLGKVLFYYGSGKIKRIESWGNYEPLNHYYAEEKGKWTFYKRNGNIKKELIYYLEDRTVFKRTIRYDKNNDIKYEKNIDIMVIGPYNTLL